jgi:hypothetical protein
MRIQEKSMQQLDPLAAAASWDTSVFFVIVTWSYAVLATVTELSEATFPIVMIVALASLTIGGVAHLWYAAPRQWPYRRSHYVVVVGFVVTAGTLQVISMAGFYQPFLAEWGPIAVALIFAAASGYRPVLDQHIAGLFAAVTIGSALFITAMYMETPFGPLYYSVAGVTLLSVVVLGQAAYTRKASTTLRTWHANISQASSEVDIPVLSKQLQPQTQQAEELIVSLLESGKISAQDSKRAAELATELRRELIALSSQTWVEHSGYSLDDPDHLLERFDVSAQSAVSALMAGLSTPSGGKEALSLRQDPHTRKISCVLVGALSVDSEMTTTEIRSMLAPYMRVMHVVFDDVRLINHEGEVKVMFYYVV